MSAELPHPLCLVEWVDSAWMHGWNDADEVDEHDVSACITVGFLVRENETLLMLTASVDRTHENVSDVIAIPKVCITAQRTLEGA